MPPSPPPSATPDDGRSSPTVSVVIPVVDEGAGLPHVLNALPPVDEVIVVDAGPAGRAVSTARATRPGTRVVRQTRTGEGNALACGLAASHGDIVVTLSADGSTDPRDIPRFVAALTAGADVAHGSRFRPGGGDPAGGRRERLAAAILSRVVNACLGIRCTDPTWGYNAFRREALPALDLPGPRDPGPRRGRPAWGDGPEITPLVVVRAAVEGLRVVEVAGVRHPRVHGDGRRDLFHRALLVLQTLIVEMLRRRRSRATSGPRARRSTAVRPAPRAAVSSPPAAATAETAAGRHAAAVPRARRGPRPSGLPVPPAGTPAARPFSPAGPPAASGLPPVSPGLPFPASGFTDSGRGLPPAAFGPPDGGRDAVRGLDDRRRGYPGPRPAWATGGPGAYRPIANTGYDTGVRRGGVYDTGVHRAGFPAPGAHGTGVHHLPDENGPMYRQSAPREVGGSRRRLDARHRRAERPDLTVIPGEGRDAGRDRETGRGRETPRDRYPEYGRDEQPGRRAGRPGHLRAVPRDRFGR